MTTEQGRDWQVEMIVTDTVSPALKQVNITVAPVIEGQTRRVVTDIHVMINDEELSSGSLELSQQASRGNL